MAKCGDCIHFQKCSHYVTAEETFPEVGGCSAFKNKGDFVEVVRCKDCTFCKVDNTVFMKDVFGNENETPNYHCLRGYGYNKPDHFCSRGERREGE